ncbi:BMP family lipoprotein [Pseudonocardia parietis]|uniref:Basic membrane protein A n=1 Tax=Pseudonocardia parietis TaxID=570936 RepID=A0ABS4VPT5_9PSEU|nr:BMP family ABC transporter substrate-binding protein [Pseudonocardia parietis]MBP2365935.1 basic membrane protein A [Pseudonocardia parietis]
MRINQRIGRRGRFATAVAIAAVAALALSGCARDTGGGGTAQGGECERVAPPSVPAASAQPEPDKPKADASALKVGLAYDIGGRGDASFNDAAAAGLDQAVAELGLQKANAREATAQQGESEDAGTTRLRQLAQGGFNPVIAVGFNYAKGVDTVAREFPQTKFAIVDDDTVDLPNVTPLVFAEEQGSFLVGVAAALKTETCKVGFIGGVDSPLIQKFDVGYQQGAEAAAPSIEVDSDYISPAGDFSGFNDATRGTEIASGQYDAGSDISFAAAGQSNQGVFAAAKDTGRRAIGVDSDQYNSPQLTEVRDVIMTSMVKRVDVAVYDYINAVAGNTIETLPERFDLKNDGVGYSTSGGFVDDIKPQLEAYKAAIIAGEIQVSSTK